MLVGTSRDGGAKSLCAVIITEALSLAEPSSSVENPQSPSYCPVPVNPISGRHQFIDTLEELAEGGMFVDQRLRHLGSP